MHFLPSAKDYTRHTLAVTPGQTVRDLFTSNGYIIANFTSGDIQGSPAALNIGTMDVNNIFSFVLTTNGWVWIRDKTLTNGEVKSSLVYASGTLKSSHVQSLLTSNMGKRFIAEWCKTVLVSDVGGAGIDQKELIDYYLDLNEPEKYLSSALERYACEQTLLLIKEGYIPQTLFDWIGL
jgi:hypothetical protein